MGGDIGRKMPERPWTDDDMEKASEATRRERKRARTAEQREAELVEALRRLITAVGKQKPKTTEINSRPALRDGEQEVLAALMNGDALLAKHEQEKDDGTART